MIYSFAKSLGLCLNSSKLHPQSYGQHPSLGWKEHLIWEPFQWPTWPDWLQWCCVALGNSGVYCLTLHQQPVESLHHAVSLGIEMSYMIMFKTYYLGSWCRDNTSPYRPLEVCLHLLPQLTGSVPVLGQGCGHCTRLAGLHKILHSRPPDCLGRQAQHLQVPCHQP